MPGECLQCGSILNFLVAAGRSYTKKYCTRSCYMKAWRASKPLGPRANYVRIKRTEKRSGILSWYNKQKSGPCLDCTNKFPVCCMDFDHRDGSKKEHLVSRLVKYAKSIEELAKEIAKCDLVCSNCHRIRTNKRRFDARQQRLA